MIARFLLPLAVGALLLTRPAPAQTGPDSLRRAIAAGATYAATHLLDSVGRARGDYDLLTGQWHEYEAMWHTGQAINALLDAYSLTRDSVHLKAAIRAGNWWVAQAYTAQPNLRGYLRAIHGAEVGNLINTTTISDGTPGLFKLSRLTRNPRYADCATRAGQWMIDHLWLPDSALLYNFVDPETGEVWRDKSPHPQHNRDGRISLTEAARPNAEGALWLDMFRHTGQVRYKTLFLSQMDGLVRRQSANGCWMDFEPNDPETGKVHPRFNTWNAEALLDAYDLTRDVRYRDAALRTARALLRLQQPGGGMFYTNFLGTLPDAPVRVREESVCGSAVSFAGLLWLRLSRLGYAEFDPALAKARRWVLQSQFSPAHPDPNLAGAFLETKVRLSKDGHSQVMIRDLATIFALRFLTACAASPGNRP